MKFLGSDQMPILGSQNLITSGGVYSGLLSKRDITQTDLVLGTQTASTGTWTGVANSIASLYDGLEIIYYLPYAGSGNATLNLTLSDGSTTGAIPCYYCEAMRITTQMPAYSNIHLVYRTDCAGITTGGWWVASTMGIVPVYAGGTNATTATDARTNLDVMQRGRLLWSGTATPGTTVTASENLFNYTLFMIGTNSGVSVIGIREPVSGQYIFAGSGWAYSGGMQIIGVRIQLYTSNPTRLDLMYLNYWNSTAGPGTYNMTSVVGLVKTADIGGV